MADRRGRVWGSVPGIANRARVSVDEARKAIEAFLSPDPDSRTKDYEGKRIAEIDGGWRLLNYDKYRSIQDEEGRKEYQREWVKQRRQEKSTVDTSRSQSTQAEAEAEAIKEKEMATSPPAAATAASACPVQKVVELYHEKLKALPRVEKLTKAREGYIKQRWREDLTDLDDWAAYFDHVSRSAFLMGREQPTNGRPPFRADLEWLTRPANFAKVYEGKYHG